jgi:hypothetical protein
MNGLKDQAEGASVAMKCAACGMLGTKLVSARETLSGLVYGEEIHGDVRGRRMVL